MTRSLDLDDLVEHFTLYPDELDLLQGKRGANRLGFSVLLKHLLWMARFRDSREVVDGIIYRYRTGVRGGTCPRCSARGRRCGSGTTGTPTTAPGTGS